MGEYVYLDYAATAPLCEEAANALRVFLDTGALHLEAGGGNANSLHTPGRHAFDLMEKARKSIARDLNASRPAEIIFTAGATESDNAALFGLTFGALEQRHKQGKHSAGHIIVSAIEHDAVLEPARRLEREGVSVTYLPVNKSGFVEPASLEAAFRDDTVLVSIMMANSEVGSVQPVKELAAIAHKNGALFHTDATQALGKIPVDLQELGADAVSFSGHKIGAPKGIGLLYLKARTPFKAQLLGGGQEEGRRSGTQNVPAMCAFAAACHAAVEMQQTEALRLSALRDSLYQRLAGLPGVSATVTISSSSDDYLPNIVHVLVEGMESETLIIRLDYAGFGVSGGSACASHSLEPSHVLKAMGISADRAYGALRVSMGRYTTEAQLDAFMDAFKECIKK